MSVVRPACFDPGQRFALYYAALALMGLVFAFVGLGHASLWADELFTLQVVDHDQGLADVYRRVLSDVHPPLHDFLLYGWLHAFGQSDAALRGLSACLSVLAMLFFARGAWRRLGPAATAFACALATGSMFWFSQAQNARDYALAMCLSAALLALTLAWKRSRSPGLLALLMLTGLLGSQSHPYMLLLVGVLWACLLLSAASWTQRAMLLVSGMVILTLYLGLMWQMQHIGGKQHFSGAWFRNSWPFLGSHLRRVVFNGVDRLSLLALMLCWLGGVRHRATSSTMSADEAWATRLCLAVFTGTLVAGIAVSLLVTPSFSYRNVLVAAPFGWYLLGHAYRINATRLRGRLGTMLLVLMALAVGCNNVALLRGRWLPTNEPWRASAAFVQSLPACANTTLAVPASAMAYGSLDNPATQDLVRYDYYGYYLPQAQRIAPMLLSTIPAYLASQHSPCPLLIWGVHDFSDESLAIAFGQQLLQNRALHLQSLRMQTFVSYDYRWLRWQPQAAGYVLLRDDGSALQPPASMRNGHGADDRSIGELLRLHPDGSIERAKPARSL